MKWLLVAIVMGSPVKTDLVFESLEACLRKEAEMRQAWTDMYNKSSATFKASEMSKEEIKQSTDFIRGQMAFGTCVPAK